MRGKVTFLLVSLALTCACSKPPPPGTTNDLSDLPRFELITVISAQLLQVGPKNEVLTNNSGPSTSYQAIVSPIDIREYLRPVSQPKMFQDQLHVDNKGEQVGQNMFLDESGKLQPYLQTGIVAEFVDGEKVGLRPLRIPSSKYRYFVGRQGIYAGNRASGKIEKIFDNQNITSVSGRNDLLFTAIDSPLGYSEVFRFGVGIKPKSIHQGVLCRIANIGLNGSVTIQDAQDFICVDSAGRAQSIPNANFEVAEFQYRGKSWFVGFRRIMSSDNKVLNSYPAIWNSKGETIPLIKLCPELDGKIIRLQNMHIAKIMTNSNGLIAFEMSGSNPNPEYNIGGPNPGGMSDRNYSWQTYVIKAVGATPKVLAP